MNQTEQWWIEQSRIEQNRIGQNREGNGSNRNGMIEDWILVAAQTNREVDKQRKEGDEG